MPAPEPRIIELAEVDSTNDEARRRAEAGEVPPFWVRADVQTAGRGRRGRTWVTRPGNLFLSGLFHLSCPPAEAAQLAFAAALAVGEVLDVYVDPRRIAFKWPNDVKAGGAKIAGVLLEARQVARGLELVVGVGVNLASAPADAGQAATSLKDSTNGKTVAPSDAARQIASAFERWRAVWAADGFASIRASWLARAEGLGERVRAQGPNGVVEGVFEDLDENGALVIDGPSGRHTIRSGEVFFGSAEEAG
ncbi:MAG: biotin--[acetyl-CoA-carboxylase] ligase [Maricaulaceae bacterium]